MRDETAAGAAAGDGATGNGPAGDDSTVQDGTAGASAAGDGAAGDAAAGDGAPRAAGRRHRRLGLGAGAAVSAAAVAVAAFAVAGALSGPARPSSVIPAPPRANKVFVEDDNGTGADNQANILHSAAPGLVHVLPVPGRQPARGSCSPPPGSCSPAPRCSRARAG